MKRIKHWENLIFEFKKMVEISITDTQIMRTNSAI